MNNFRALATTPLSRTRRIACAATILLAILGTPSSADADVSQREHRVATGAVERAEREMRADGAHRSSLQGCWAAGSAIDCTGFVYGRDADVKWRCIVLLTVRKTRTRLVARMTDAACTAEEAGGRRRASAR